LIGVDFRITIGIDARGEQKLIHHALTHTTRNVDESDWRRPLPIC
jgi:hypothetical protein